MPNNRNKGKVIERWFVNNGLKEVFPDVRRNAGTQAQSGGRDLENTGIFNFEIKGGKAYASTLIRMLLNQVQLQGEEGMWDVVLVRPEDRVLKGRKVAGEPYALIPYSDFLEILNVLKNEGII